MSTQKGQISVQAENIFPIIKQFLYSDREVFLRELISNAVDATSKLKTLSNKGEVKGDLGEIKIEVIADQEAKTLTIRDRGIGMTEEEVKKYLNQVAFSSAQDFLDKYKEDANIIGHFGLGFYSAFMVADKVEVRTKSYQADAEGVTWVCEGDPSYELDTNDKDFRGTDIILHISEDGEEFLEESRLSELLGKYCKFLPVPIQFGTRTESETEGEGDDAVTTETEVPNIVNNPEPLWKKQPADLTDEQYSEFYNELYPFSAPPLFHIHLNIDYPFNLTGVLYFPKLNNSIEVQKNKIQLYSNQVFVTDDVSEIVPEFLTLLHGVIDSPDIPLNVSRSYLQSDSNVRKISGYITKKVADKLKELFKKERADFEAKWSDLGVFIKYGMLSDDKFREKAQKFALVKNTEGEFYTLDDYKEKVKEAQTDKHDKIVLLYTSHPDEFDSYVQAARNEDYDVLLMDQPMIDNHWMQLVERELGVTFVRVDSDTVDNLVQKDETKESVLSEADQEKVKGLFEKLVAGGGMTRVELKPLSPSAQPVQITKPEFMHRFAEMQQMQMPGGQGMPESYNVVVNSNHPLIADKLTQLEGEGEQEEFTNYLYDLARLNQHMLKGKDMTAFIERSLKFLEN